MTKETFQKILGANGATLTDDGKAVVICDEDMQEASPRCPITSTQRAPFEIAQFAKRLDPQGDIADALWCKWADEGEACLERHCEDDTAALTVNYLMSQWSGLAIDLLLAAMEEQEEKKAA